MKFKTWLEFQELAQDAEAAILGVLQSMSHINDTSELKTMQIGDFDSSVRAKIKGLGIIKNIRDDNEHRYQDIIQAIDSPSTAVQDLIDKIASPDGNLPVGSQSSGPISDPRLQSQAGLNYNIPGNR